MAMNLRISLKDIAHEAGVSAMTVSRALRNDPKVLPDTKARVLEFVREMGYQPDPNLQQMMGYMRKARVGRRNAAIAFVWPDLSPQASADLPHLQRMVKGASRRAEESGFGLDEFWLQGAGMSATRLCSVLDHRGIQCVLLAPLCRRAHGHLRMEWDRYSVVTTGLGLWRPQLHRVHFDHYGSMVTAMRKLAHGNRKRIAMVVERELHERMHRARAAAFLAHHPLGPSAAARLLLVVPKLTPEKVIPFLEKNNVEVLVGGMDTNAGWLDHLKVPEALAYVTLSRSDSHPEIPGIDERYDLLGSDAVDMVIAQFHRRERGVPERPKVILTQGEWREPTSPT